MSRLGQAISQLVADLRYQPEIDFKTPAKVAYKMTNGPAQIVQNLLRLVKISLR